LRVGDVIKFGRVPFKIKESSVEKLSKKNESVMNQERTWEKNITDIESMDEHDLEKVVKEMIQPVKLQTSAPRRSDVPFLSHNNNFDIQDSEVDY
jgi:hypothetical protein